MNKTLTKRLRALASIHTSISPILLESADELDRLNRVATDMKNECRLLEIELQTVRRKIRDGKTPLVPESLGIG
jgi:hypothetical protein